uniref:WW domain-containing protein n=1 Tax=Plectus sambesii TaxID=2011161 RepID=A0A914W627_9BILA
MLLELMAARYDDQRNSHHNPRNAHYYNNGNARPNNAKETAAVHGHARGSFDKRRSEGGSFRDKGNDYHKHRRDKSSYSSQEKTRLKEFGDWSEQTSSSGKRYFYNRITEVSQWDKPTEWAEYERGLPERNQRSPRSSGSSCRQPSARPSTSTYTANTTTAAEDAGSEQMCASRESPIGQRHEDGGRQSQSQSRHFVSRNADVRAKRDRAEERSSPADDVAKRRRLEDSHATTVDPSGGSSAPAQPSVGIVNGNGGRPALDLSKLPDLLVRVVAERLGFDVSEQRAFDHLQRSFNVKKPTVPSSDRDDSEAACSATDPSQPAASAADAPQATSMDDSPSCSADIESREVEDERATTQQQREVDEAPPIATLSSEHARFYRSSAGSHAAGWAADHFEAQAWVHAASALELSLRLGDNSADLKCARSLVRTAEIRSTLLRQKLLFVSQQLRQLASSTRPPP